MTLWERMEKVAEALEGQANDYFTKSNASRFDADLQMRLYNHSCAYQNAANEIRDALKEHAMKEDAVEKQAEYGERRTVCPLYKAAAIQGYMEKGKGIPYVGPFDEIACDGERCGMYNLCQAKPRGIDVKITPPPVPGL